MELWDIFHENAHNSLDSRVLFVCQKDLDEFYILQEWNLRNLKFSTSIGYNPLLKENFEKSIGKHKYLQTGLCCWQNEHDKKYGQKKFKSHLSIYI